MHKGDRARVGHMVDASQSAIRFMAGRQRADLDSDQLLLFAVVRAVELVGEAASKISVATRTNAPEIPWSAITSMRNRLIHGYFDIDAEIVWKTTTLELPTLLPQLQALRDRLQEAESSDP